MEAEVTILRAIPTDADDVSAMLESLVAAGKRTSPGDPDFALNNYIVNPDGILCSVAVGPDGSILGLQSLKRATIGNRFDTPVGWGIIGTHVTPSAARRGVGARLFQASKTAAATAAITNIEAYIGAANLEGQAYYEAMGFRTYRTAEKAISKVFRMEGS
ncbi:GNAT family N-acetyltransferase [Actibacterium sp. 188UL27-1]|uniref:GNAT family N-acetyltransferase n=1 Tax=Actibacterium sp. 188UL27-1 TaxID=2786961 RepID=UPI001EF5B14B|nr:GNAT family N-acetyltransferase [Actibacterium sp. 188UL27-1]